MSNGAAIVEHTAAGAGPSQRVIVFDVIETLLDLRALAPAFEQAFGDPAVLQQWFNQMLQSAFAITVAGIYVDFGSVARGALQMTAERRGVVLTDQGVGHLLGGVRSLPPHPDAAPGLGRLREAGFRLAALTNSARNVLEAQVSSAGLAGYFEQLLSVDAVRQFKPAPAVYRSAAASLGAAVHQVRMVAAHSWDVGGALRAGCAAAFVARENMVLDPLFERPDIVGRDLVAVAQAITTTDSPLPAAG
jgi:2-haloacid dehalogenase